MEGRAEENVAGNWLPFLFVQCAASERYEGEQPDHSSCSLRPHDETVVPQCAQ